MKDLTQGNISKNLLLYAIPVIFSGVLSRLYISIDKIMVSKLLGDAGLAAIGSTSSFITLMSSLMWGLTTGISLFVAFLAGQGDGRQTANAIKTGLWITAVTAVAVAAAAMLGQRGVFSMLHVGEDIYADAYDYYMLYFVGFVFFLLKTGASYIFNALGKPQIPFYISLADCVLNILANLLFIVTLRMGVRGAALATVIVGALLAAAYLVLLGREMRRMSGGVRVRWRLRKHEVGRSLAMAIPCMLQQCIMYISGTAVQPMINLLGSAAIAAYSICIEIYNLNATIFQNSSRGLSSFCAQCYGGEKVHLVRRGFRASLLQGFALTLPIMAFLLLGKDVILSLYLSDVTAESAVYVTQYIYLCVPFIVLQVINNLFHNFLRGVMMPRLAMISTALYSAVRIAATYLLVPTMHITGVFIGFISAWCAEFLLLTVLYLTGAWKNKRYRELTSREGAAAA